MSKRGERFRNVSITGLVVPGLILIVIFSLVQPGHVVANNDFRSIDEKTRKLANRYVKIWQTPELRKQCLSDLHRQNPEWDFMFRTYSVLSFSNLSLHTPEKCEEYLKTIDSIIDNTLDLERKKGFKYFLLRYGQGNRWRVRPGRSLFIDGEIALMLGVRCLVKDNELYKNELNRRVNIMVEGMTKSPVLCAESYPDECWVFCNTIALAAIRISDELNGTDHSEFFSHWVEKAKKNLIDPKTGLLRSAFTVAGTPTSSAKGPEGSSIWMACHMLQIVNEEFAQNQYAKAKGELLGDIFDFGYAREWPKSYLGSEDIDSGPVIPFLMASPSSSGLAILCTASFKDKENFNKLTRSLNTFAFPKEENEQLYYQMSNALGDAVLLYGFTVGPVWEKVLRTADRE